MEMFTYQFEFIKKVGFFTWLRTYPVNPLTIVATVVVIGIIILILNARKKRIIAEENKVQDSALIILKKQNMSNIELAEQIRVVSINGERANWFFHKTRPAIYIKPGENEVVVYAQWSQSVQKHFKTQNKKLKLNLHSNSIYTIYYIIERGQYLLCEGDKYEDGEWENKLNKNCIIL